MYRAAFPGQAALPTLSQFLGIKSKDDTFLPLENIQCDILYVLSFCAVAFKPNSDYR